MFAHALSIRRWRAITSLYVVIRRNRTITRTRPTAKLAAYAPALIASLRH